jgi:molybdopterin molybdotransferase
MRPDLFRQLLPFDEALRQVLDAAHPVSRTVTVPIVEASGRVAASDVVSPVDVPAFDRAAMDGYAVRSGDLAAATAASPAALTCIDRIFTGRPSARSLGVGECAEIATGAPMPDGADAVVMVERTSREADRDRILVHEAVRPGQNVGARAADIAIGQLALRQGDLIGPARAGAVSAIGQTSVEVYERPRVAIIATGNEVVEAGRPLALGQVYDINRVTLSAIVRQHGGVPDPAGIVADSEDELVAALERAAFEHDVIVTSGGSSVGGRDLLVDAIARCGRIAFHGIAVKPGKPTLFGTIGDTPIFGMPGNPTSCLSNALILLVPFLRRVARLPEWQPARVRLPLARAVPGLADRHQFYTVRIVDGRAEPAFKSSGDITSMAAADGYIEIPAGSAGVPEGEFVEVVRF